MIREQSRRAVLGGALGLMLAGCFPSRYSGPERTVVLAGGEPGGFYQPFAELLAQEITAAEPRLLCTVRSTEGSVDNIRLVASGRADVGIALADAVHAARAALVPFADEIALPALGRVYENYVQLVVRADGPVRSLDDLAGRTISVGAPGSGAAIFGSRLLAAARLPSVVRHLPIMRASRELAAGRIAAFLFAGGVPTPALTALDREVGIRVLPLHGVLPSLRARFGTVYEQVPMPTGAYRGVRATPTVGIANLLVCRSALPDDMAGAIVRVLVERAGQLVPAQAVGTQFLDVRSLIGTGSAPLHPGAAEAYRALHG